MKEITVAIKESTDNRYLGIECKTDLKTLELPDRTMQIDFRMHRGDGVWQLWNSNYIVVAEEVGKVSGFTVEDGKIKDKVVNKATKKGK